MRIISSGNGSPEASRAREIRDSDWQTGGTAVSGLSATRTMISDRNLKSVTANRFRARRRKAISFHIGSYFCSQGTACSDLKIGGFSASLDLPFGAAVEE
jgi:hypothetical protein